ncbi:MAG: hypothetical protein F4X92_00180 [Gammaproteobacteria bacterium]|nr:hypothetical protein [Gammaproteobacteria bacterium]
MKYSTTPGVLQADCLKLGKRNPKTGKAHDFRVFVHSIEALLSIGLLVWFFTYPWQSLCVDIARQHLFKLREQLFYLAMSQRIGFDDQAYRGLREGLNSRIRLAHKIKIGELITVIPLINNSAPVTPGIVNVIEAVDDLDLRNDLRNIYTEANRVLVMHMIVRSPLILVLTVFAPLFFLVEIISGNVRIFIT